MADSIAKEGEKVRCRKPFLRSALFSHAIRDLEKEKIKQENLEKKFRQQFICESDTQNVNSSKEILNEPNSVEKKNSSFCQKEPLSSNDKPYEDHTKQASNSRQLFDKNDDSPDFIMRISRHSKSHDISSNSVKYQQNIEQDCNIVKSCNISDKSKSNFSNNDYNGDTSCMKTFKCNSNIKQSDSSNIYQEKLFPSNDKSNEDDIKKTSNYRQSVDQDYSMRIPRHVRSPNNSYDSNEYHMSARQDHHSERSYKPNFLKRSDSDVITPSMKNSKYNSNYKYSGSNNIPTRNFEKDCSNTKQFSTVQKPHYCKNSKPNNFNSSQHQDSLRDSVRKNLPNYNFNSDQCFKLQDKVKPGYKLRDPSTKVEESFSVGNLDCKNHSEDETTDIKHQRVCSELDETLENSKMNNIKITLNVLNPNPVVNTSLVSNSLLIPPVSNAPISSVLSTSTSSTPVSPVSNGSSISLISNSSPVFSSMSVLETSSNLLSNAVVSNVFIDPLNNERMGMYANEDFIPPPVSCSSISEDLSSSAEKNETFLQKSGSESTEVSSFTDETTYFSLPDSEHLQAISKFISKVVEERSVSSSTADRVANDLNRFFKNNFEGNVIEYYGSYQSDLAITTSDINLMIQVDVSIRKSFMLEIHKLLNAKLERYHVQQYEEGIAVNKCKINITHPDTGINCELTYLGKYQDKFLKMGKFLKAMCRRNIHVKSLIIIAKVWAEHLNINEVEDGKLHSIGFTLLVIHFLQHCKNPVLPIYSCEKEDLGSLPHNDSSIGALWLDFLRYYTFTFNWQEDIITVTSVNRVSKISKHWENYWMAIEDPFTGKNIAATVTNKDVADYIKSCFRATYMYFFNGPEIIPNLDKNDNEGSVESSGSQMEFSFNDCIVEQSEDICEMCEEINDICDECKKKIYVQPMASMPKMTDDFLKIVKKALSTVYEKYILSEEEVNQRKNFVKKLENDVRRIYPDAQMRLFGSSANGFGFKRSDLDICMTFKSQKGLKSFVVLKNLRDFLRRDKKFVSVVAIFSAQIPILKFRYEPFKWCGDISLDNVLAVHNSELLYTYSLVDERCKILGCILKLIAKKALIAEVTEKALSSYSYLIMVIHFLQQTDPPVLPVLQDNQFRQGNFELDHIVDNCNVWFCSDLDYIRKTFKTENDTAVEQLFLDLLDYYCSFDCNRVITIRQKEILPICEKMRSARLFNIQDPFLVNRNLGCVVSPTKAQETKSVLNRARGLFRTPKKELQTDLESHFFSTMNLTGRYQKEVLCDFCGKFGHDQKDCKQSFLPFQKKFFFKWSPKKMQYPNQNAFKRKQAIRHPFMQKC